MATEKETFLYKITNPKGRIYIGQTVDPHRRVLVYRLAASVRMIGNTHAKGSVRSEEFKKNASDKLKGINKKGKH